MWNELGVGGAGGKAVGKEAPGQVLQASSLACCLPEPGCVRRERGGCEQRSQTGQNQSPTPFLVVVPFLGL